MQGEPVHQNLSSSFGGTNVPDIKFIQVKCKDYFGYRACRWQAEFAQVILGGQSDIILEVATGGGKTLAFWLPLLFRPRGIQIVVTALNTLGKQNVRSLADAGISAISIDGTIPHANLSRIFKKIKRETYRAIIISPEQLMKEDGHFERLLKSTEFQENIISIIIDKGHCVKTWGKFRPEYQEIQRLSKKKKARASQISGKRKRQDNHKTTPAKKFALSPTKTPPATLTVIPAYTDEPEDESNTDSESAEDTDLDEELCALYSHNIAKEEDQTEK
ncbi:hypothetical protein EW026_g7173 [Hermanssonia centrifuga]|uniref:DNA 3'-5' helicase n=1 Tax=Hermanssonia centrifuga TaxID=98765 RepID=A0A4V3X9H9_9APHY|nr:hypothetical protein EW026_g7173 [Hermanssonia centrifuga]